MIYLSEGGSTELTLEDATYTVKWYDPRKGGELKNGSVTSITGPGAKSIGNAPSHPHNDWVILLENQNSSYENQ